MSGIEDTAGRLNRSAQGTQVSQTAEALHGKKLISDEQLRELQNGAVGPQDIAIGNEALKKLLDDPNTTMDSMKLMTSVMKMNSGVLAIQQAQVQADLAALKK